MSEGYKRNPNTECIVCSKPIYKRPWEIRKNKGRVFCSINCYGISNRREVPCIVCGKMIMTKYHKKTCGRSCSNINRAGIKYHIGRPKDKVVSQHALKLRLIVARGTACERCGYDRKEILQVHHKDKNRQNNDLANLELICPNCHCEEHYGENKWLNLDFKPGEVA